MLPGNTTLPSGYIRRPAIASGLLALALVSLLGAACSGGSASGMASPGPVAGDIEPIMATRALEVGEQRVAFLLSTPKALVEAPQATLTATYLEDGSVPAEAATASFRPWPYGVRGSYATRITFDRPGLWRLDITVDAPDTSGSAAYILEVQEDSQVPSLGETPPPSDTRTLAQVGGVEKLTSDYTPDPDLYHTTLADMVASGEPGVIVFATPAFCTSPSCGPQVDTVSELKENYQGQAQFRHVEIYDNPDEIQGDLERARLSPAVREWGFDRLPEWFNESWTFVLDSQGRVHQRFEGYATLEELEESLQEVLAQG